MRKADLEVSRRPGGLPHLVCHDQFRDLGFMRIPDYPLHTGEFGQLLRRALRVAAGDQNSCRGVFAVDAADGVPHVFVGGGCDGAGVEDYQIRAGAFIGGLQALSREQRFQCRAVGLCSPAPEILYVVFPHPLAIFACGSGVAVPVRRLSGGVQDLSTWQRVG